MFPSPARVGEALKLPHEHLLFVEYLMMVMLTSVWYYHIVVLICISLILSDLEIPLMCLLAVRHLQIFSTIRTLEEQLYTTSDIRKGSTNVCTGRLLLRFMNKTKKAITKWRWRKSTVMAQKHRFPRELVKARCAKASFSWCPNVQRTETGAIHASQVEEI